MPQLGVDGIFADFVEAVVAYYRFRRTNASFPRRQACFRQFIPYSQCPWRCQSKPHMMLLELGLLCSCGAPLISAPPQLLHSLSTIR